MNRREILTLLGAAGAAWPAKGWAQAQQSERVRRIGILVPASSDDAEFQARVAAFHQGLAQWDWIIGSNVRIETRWAGTKAADIRRHAAELAALTPDVIFANGNSTVVPLQQATRAVPIVFVQAGDPVGTGIVESLARPGGNATGYMQFEYSMAGKWLELLEEISPSVKRVAVIRDATLAGGVGQWSAVQTVAPSFGVELTPVSVRDVAEIERIVTTFARGSMAA